MTSAVITGLGVIAPNGLGTEEYWQATLSGTSGLAPISRFDAEGYPARVFGEVRGFDAPGLLPGRLLPQTDQMTRMALVAADQALADAAVEPAAMPEFGMGVVTASSAGGFEFAQRELEALWSKDSTHVSAYQSFAWFYAVNTGQISIRNGMRGPSGVVVTEQAGSLDALGQARRQLRKGAQLIVSGGVDSSLCPWGLVAQLTSGMVSTGSYLPFSKEASGFVPGEGGAILILEDAAAARERGAPQVYGELGGYSATFDPRPGSGRSPTLQRAIEEAVADAGLTPRDIDVVFADAAAVPEWDRVESAALEAVFRPQAVPVTAPKTMTGRLYAGGASLDVATALLSLRDQVIPPTVGMAETAEEHRIDLVTGPPREARLTTALVIARGAGGFNAAAVVRAL